MRDFKGILGAMALAAHTLFGVEPISEFKSLPKAELHLHLGGSFPKEYLDSIATPEQQDALARGLALIASGVDYHEAFSVFRTIGEIVNSEEKLQKGVEALCVALQEDNVRYVEIRTSLKNLGYGFEAYLQAVLQGIANKTSGQFKANVLLSLQRNSSPAAAKETVDLAIKYQRQGVAGIDISGNSTNGQIDSIVPELLRAKEAGFPFLVHMGEDPNETDQMLLLTRLEPKRIGHGVYLSPEANEWIAKRQTPIEVCLSSSVLVKMILAHKEHPGFDLFHSNHPIVLCTDDPLLFSTTLSQELMHAHQHWGLPLEEVRKAAARAFEYAVEPAAKSFF